MTEKPAGKANYPEPLKAPEFDTAAYAQQLYRDLEHGVRTNPALRGRTTSEIDKEVEYQQSKESGAIRQLNTREVAACSVLGVKPSQFLLYRPRPVRKNK